MAAYDPFPPRIAAFEPGERHLYSFVLSPLQRRREGGFILKITAYYPDGTSFVAHLTDRRILIEPRPQSRMAQLAVGGLALATMVMAPEAGGAARAAIGSLERASAIMSEQGETVYSFPYGHVKSVESFRQGVAILVRIRLKIEPSDELVFTVGAPGKGAALLGHAKEFVQILTGLMAGEGSARRD